jgi:hypothetical protein
MDVEFHYYMTYITALSERKNKDQVYALDKDIEDR